MFIFVHVKYQAPVEEFSLVSILMNSLNCRFRLRDCLVTWLKHFIVVYYGPLKAEL